MRQDNLWHSTEGWLSKAISPIQDWKIGFLEDMLK